MTFQFFYRHAIACLLFMVALLACQDDGLVLQPSPNSERQTSVTDEANGTMSYTPVIKLFSPISGYVSTPQRMGTIVSIHGGNFGAHPNLNVVRFNGILANVIQCTSNEIITEVPAGATTGKISVTRNGVTVVSKEDFTVTPPTAPVVDGFTPLSGTPPAGTSPGTTVTIFGFNFNPKPLLNEVKFNGVSADVIDSNFHGLTVTVPAGATTGRITVTANGFTASSATDFIVNPVLLPAIHAFSPASGTPGTAVAISGANFNPTPAGNVVTFNGVPATVSSATTSQLIVTVPPGAATGPITVTVNGVTAISATSFTVLGASTPVITNFFPGFVTQTEVNTGHFMITIFGSNFSPIPSENHVIFAGGGFPAFVVFASPTELHVEVPIGTTTGPIRLEVNGAIAFSPYALIVDPFHLK